MKWKTVMYMGLSPIVAFVILVILALMVGPVEPEPYVWEEPEPETGLTSEHASALASMLADSGFSSRVVVDDSTTTVHLEDGSLRWTDIEELTRHFVTYGYNNAGTGKSMVFVYNNGVLVSNGIWSSGSIKVNLKR